MGKVDCLLIGHNEMQFSKYEKSVRALGTDTEMYRDLMLNFVSMDSKPYTFTELLNSALKGTHYLDQGDISLGDVFSPAISYLGSYLNKHKLTFEYINSYQDEKEKLKELLLNHEILSIAVITTLYVSLKPIVEIIRFVKSVRPGITIIVGGPYVSTQARTLNKDALNYTLKVIGAEYFINESQGEHSLVQLLKYLKGEAGFDQVMNVIYRSHENCEFTKVEKEANRLENNKINWSLFPEAQGGKILGLRTAISCPFSCAFCGFPQHAGRYQTEDVDNVTQDFACIQQLKSARRCNIIDDTFNVPITRFKEILRNKIKYGIDFKWNSYIRCQFLDEEAVDLMKRSGCEGAFLGIESANPQILRNMNKKATVEDYVRGIKLLKQYGIMTFASFIFGFPGEDHATIQDSIQFIETNQPDFYRIQLWYCEKITPIWSEKEKYGISGSGFTWSHNKMNSKEASMQIIKAFTQVEHSIWLPQYNFDFVGIFGLLNRGLRMQEIKQLIVIFNHAIKDKLTHAESAEISEVHLEKMRKAVESGVFN